MLPRRQWLEKGAAVCSLFFALAVPCAFGQSPDMVSLEDARRLHEAGQAILIDIREPQEHATGVATGAKLFLYGGMSDWAKRGWPMMLPAKH
jgi:hypothetical protein